MDTFDLRKYLIENKLNEAEGNDLYYTAGEMISQVGLFTQKNADEMEADGSGNLYRFFDTPEERAELIKISEAYPAYLAKVKAMMDELMNDPMYQVAVGDVGGKYGNKLPGEILQKAYSRSQKFINEIQVKLNEGISKDEAVQALKDLIDAGELTGADVRVMMDNLKLYHRGVVNRRRTPEQRQESARYGQYIKGVNQKQFDHRTGKLKLGKIYYDSEAPVYNDLKTLKSFDITKLSKDSADSIKRSIYNIENPQEFEKEYKRGEDRVNMSPEERLRQDIEDKKNK
jgi:hypothetical protein